jgi:hypothetical protein
MFGHQSGVMRLDLLIGQGTRQPEAVTAHGVGYSVSDGIKWITKDSRSIDFARVGRHAPTFYAL